MLYALLRRAHHGDQDAVLELTKKFKPLLRKYARKLNYEDAYNDLLLNFIEMIDVMKVDSLRVQSDAGIIAYLAKAVYSHYVKNLKHLLSEVSTVNFSQLEEWQILAAGGFSSDSTGFIKSDLSEIKQLLTENEYRIIHGIFILGYSESELARAHSSTRQNICQVKKRALKKLKNYMTGGLS